MRRKQYKSAQLNCCSNVFLSDSHKLCPINYPCCWYTEKITWYLSNNITFALTFTYKHQNIHGISDGRRSKNVCQKPQRTLEHINKNDHVFLSSSFCVSRLVCCMLISFSSSVGFLFVTMCFFSFVLFVAHRISFCSVLIDMITVTDDNRSAAYNSKFTQSVFFHSV